MLFKKENTFVEPKLTAKNAVAIYGLLKEKSMQDIRLTSKFRMSEIKKVDDEMKRLESEILSKVSGSLVTKKAVPAVFTETGEIKTKEIPAVYYKAKDKKDLLKSLASDVLDVSTVLEDTIIFNPVFDKKRTYTDFINNYS